MEDKVKNVTISTLEEELLCAVSSNWRYGLEIMSEIYRVSNKKRKIGPNSLYPALHRLEKKEFIEAKWGNEIDRGGSEGARRRYYKVTQYGQEVLRQRFLFCINLAPEMFSTLVPAIFAKSNPETARALESEFYSCDSDFAIPRKL